MSLKLFDKAYLFHISYSKIYVEVLDREEADRGGIVSVEGASTPEVEEGKLVIETVLKAKFYPKGAENLDEDSVVAEAEISSKAVFHADREYGEAESSAINEFTDRQRQEFSDRHFSVVETVLMAKLKGLMADLEMPLGVPYQMSRVDHST